MMMVLFARCVLAVFFFLSPLLLFGKIILTEIMFDPSGSEHTDEFVEIYNLSEAGSVDLTGWRIGDRKGEDEIIDAGEGLVLLPGQYGVILDGDYAGNSTTYDSVIPEESLILTINGKTLGSGGLSNSKAETVLLLDAFNDSVAQYMYSLGNASGHSDEKIDLTGADTPENWSDSRIQNGTPGFRNSVARLLYDLKVSCLWTEPARARGGEDVVVWVSIHNAGTKPVNEFTVTFFEDDDGDSAVDVGEEFGSILVEEIGSEDSSEISIVWTAPESGMKKIGVWIELDEEEKPEDNLFLIEISIGFSRGSLVINEIMIDPLTGQPEWIELFHPGGDEVDLRGWRITDGDTSAQNIITRESVVVSPYEYVVISADSSLLNLFFVWVGFLIVPKGFPNLNNDFDSVVLLDLIDTVIDRVDYQENWGQSDGVSLERINPGITSSDSSNWGSCVSFEGGTPGGKNSIFTQVLPNRAALLVSPNPFSPDGDGMDDVTVISYKLPLKTSYVNLRIYDVRGRCIRTLLGASPSGSQGLVIWDGKDNEARLARIGIYVVYIEGLNSIEGVVMSAKATVVLAGIL